MRTTSARPLVVIVGVVAVAAMAGLCGCNAAAEQKRASGLVSGTGCIEASEIAVAPMQVPSLAAERTEAYAHYKHALFLAAGADSEVLLRETQTRAAKLAAQHYEDEFQAIVQRLSSAVTMAGQGAGAAEELEQLRAEARRGAAAAAAADAQWAAARVAVAVARLDAESAHAGVEAAEATVRRIETTVAEARLTSLGDAEVQSRFAPR